MCFINYTVLKSQENALEKHKSNMVAIRKKLPVFHEPSRLVDFFKSILQHKNAKCSDNNITKIIENWGFQIFRDDKKIDWDIYDFLINYVGNAQFFSNLSNPVGPEIKKIATHRR